VTKLTSNIKPDILILYQKDSIVFFCYLEDHNLNTHSVTLSSPVETPNGTPTYMQN